MNQPTPAIRRLARWLFACEAAAAGPAVPEIRLLVSICEKFQILLSTLAGVDGFRSLLSRALTLARTEAPWLGSVRIREDGSLEGPGTAGPQPGGEEAEAGGVALVAQLLGLLVTFIGKDLTLLLVRDVWPEAPFDGTESGTEENA